jgi:hypothetical protein
LKTVSLGAVLRWGQGAQAPQLLLRPPVSFNALSQWNWIARNRVGSGDQAPRIFGLEPRLGIFYFVDGSLLMVNGQAPLYKQLANLLCLTSIAVKIFLNIMEDLVVWSINTTDSLVCCPGVSVGYDLKT